MKKELAYLISGNPKRSRRTMTAMVLVVSLIAGGIAVDNVLAAPAHNDGTSGLAAVGPINDSPEFGGFPMWYKDTNGIRLELCVDQNDVRCIAGLRPDSNLDVSFPTNFPDEAFWWSGDATMRTAAGSARLVLGLEAAFVSGLPAVGEQVAFSRVRLRVDGLPEGHYTVTHPYGVDQYDVGAGAANATKSINNTVDIGDFTGGRGFDVALTGPTGPFLVWDTDQATLPAGYLADPAVSHTVTGSPYDTNYFQIVGPPDAFLGSDDICGGTDTSCIRTDLFNVQAKESLRSGVEATRVGHTMKNGKGVVDVFAKSEAGQVINVSGTDMNQTTMAGDGNGGYFARVPYTGTIPANLVLTNTTDSPITTANVPTVVDEVHVSSAIYDRDKNTITVTGVSNNETAVLTLDWTSPAAPPWTGTMTTDGAPGGRFRFTATLVDVPPASVTLSSTLGGSDSDDVVIIGGGAPPVALAAAILVNPSTGLLAPGAIFSLDGTTSTGTIGTFAWSQTAGTPVGPFALASPVTASAIGGLVVPDLGAAGGILTFELVVQRGSLSSTPATVNIAVAPTSDPPRAIPGPDQTGIKPGSIVYLDGTASTDAATYLWNQVSGPAVAIIGAETSAPNFVAPPSDIPVVLSLTVTNLNVTTPSDTAQISVTAVPDVLTVLPPQYKPANNGNDEWRIRGTSQYCAGINRVTVELMRASGTNPPISLGVIGTAAPAPLATGCSWDIRIKPAPAAIQPQNGDWLRITSRLGGLIDPQAFIG